MIEYFLHSPFKERARRYGRRQIEKAFNRKLVEDPKYDAYLEAYKEYADERSYSMRCWTIRDGSDSDHDFSVRLDKQVDKLKAIVDVYHKEFYEKYFNSSTIPYLKHETLFKHWNKYNSTDDKSDYTITRTFTFYEYC